MVPSTVILACVWAEVFGQFENTIIFPSNGMANNVPSNQNFNQVAIVNNGPGSCSCVPIGTCTIQPNDGSEYLDVRIVNNGLAPGNNCQFGTVMCCTNSTSPTNDPTCGIRKIQPTAQPVVGQASFGAYPWHAVIITKQEVYLGSGVLLDSTHMLTAAHKVAAYVNNPNIMLIRLGEWNAASNSEPYPSINVNVAKITVHPNYNPNNLENDIAVIRLNGVVPISSYPNINTACKPMYSPMTGARCYVSGLGKNAFGPSGTYQSIMREVDVPILDNSDCENRLRQTRLGANFVLHRNSFMCAGGENGKDACTGDGGAPLVCQRNNQWDVVGIVAWGVGCGTPGVPGVYTNVYNFLGWINQIIVTM